MLGGCGGAGKEVRPCIAPTLPCRRDVLRGGGEGADPQPAGAPLHRPAGLRGGARLPDLRVLPAAAGIRHPPQHRGAPGPPPQHRQPPLWGLSCPRLGPSRGATARGRCCSGSGTAVWGSPMPGPLGPCCKLRLCPPPHTIPPPSSCRAACGQGRQPAGAAKRLNLGAWSGRLHVCRCCWCGQRCPCPSLMAPPAPPLLHHQAHGAGDPLATPGPVPVGSGAPIPQCPPWVSPLGPPRALCCPPVGWGHRGGTGPWDGAVGRGRRR